LVVFSVMSELVLLPVSVVVFDCVRVVVVDRGGVLLPQAASESEAIAIRRMRLVMSLDECKRVSRWLNAKQAAESRQSLAVARVSSSPHRQRATEQLPGQL
jgi:hypothetical protein